VRTLARHLGTAQEKGRPVRLGHRALHACLQSRVPRRHASPPGDRHLIGIRDIHSRASRGGTPRRQGRRVADSAFRFRLSESRTASTERTARPNAAPARARLIGIWRVARAATPRVPDPSRRPASDLARLRLGPSRGSTSLGDNFDNAPLTRGRSCPPKVDSNAQVLKGQDL
jgi:hypothetical protein